MKIRSLLIVIVCLSFVAPLFAQGPPLSSGPNVIRYEDYGWWWNFADFKRGYFTVIGIDAVAFCWGEFDGAWWAFQENYPPAEEGIVHRLIKGDDVPASVWPAWIVEDDFDTCAYIRENPPIAAGTVDALSNDNDVYAGAFEHNRTNSWGLKAHGAMEAPDGEMMMFSAGYHCVWNQKTDKFECKFKIVLN